MNTELTPLQIAQEAYCNLYKDEYGVNPRNIDEALWNDLEWVERQIRYFYDEAEVAPEPELGYFEELMASVKDSDYDY